MIVENKTEFVRLFQEFVNSYPYTPAGLRRRAAYDEQRLQGKRNFEAIVRDWESGEDVTERVFLKLLPYSESSDNLQIGAWIHHNPAISIDFKKWEKRSIHPEDWSKMAASILNFVHCCNNDPTQLAKACTEFSELPYFRGCQTEMLNPILNALRPDKFLLMTYQSIAVINYFCNTHYSRNLKLNDYPAINNFGYNLIEKLSEILHYPGLPSLRDEDLFDMFSYWLVAIARYDFGNAVYPLDQCAEDSGIDEDTLKFWLTALERTKQAIFYGPPGTGKTFIAKKLAQHLIGGGDGFFELVQFHPAYSYEDFVVGIRPQRVDGELDYPLVPGRFLEFCNKACTCQNTCVLIIDEINRANLARVFGELMYLLEYRDETIPLVTGKDFSIPANVLIIGTMNTADRSIALVDHALRRRFAFISLYPNYDILRRYHTSTGFPVDGLIKILKQLNQEIDNPHYEVGNSFFLRSNLTEQIESIWRLEIEPYLEEYFFDQSNKVNQFRWDKVKQQMLP
ncbi:MAG TPA: AAA family ATPase [Kamptonema sp.]|nr:AAA family ATPase [Kamptonema sp.]